MFKFPAQFKHAKEPTISGPVAAPLQQIRRTTKEEWKEWLREVELFCNTIYPLHREVNDSRPYLIVNVLGRQMRGLVDSGASRTIVGEKGWRILQELGFAGPHVSPQEVRIADGRRCKVEAMIDVPFELNQVVKIISVLVVPSVSQSLILGTDFLRAMSLVLNLSDDTWAFVEELSVPEEETGLVGRSRLPSLEEEQLRDVVNAFFSKQPERLGCTSLVEHVIDTGDAQPIKQRYYPLSPAMQKVMDDELNRMLREGIVEPSKSSWSSPVVLIKKKDNTIRFCVDYRKLNQVTKRDAYPLPYVSHILDRLRNAHYLSSLDIKSAYWQVPVSAESREKTAFTVPGRGLFQFRRLPFGLHNSPATWQRLIDNVLGADLEPNVFVYLDDIVISTASFGEHIDILQKVFERLRAAGLTLNEEKCKFCQAELKYLGHIVDCHGLRVDPEKVESIVHYPEPKTPKQLSREKMGTRRGFSGGGG